MEMVNVLVEPTPRKTKKSTQTITESLDPRLEYPGEHINMTNRTDPLTYERRLKRGTVYNTGNWSNNNTNADKASGGDASGGARPKQTQGKEQDSETPKNPFDEPVANSNVNFNVLISRNFDEQRRSTSHSDLLGLGKIQSQNIAPNRVSTLNISANPFMPYASRNQELRNTVRNMNQLAQSGNIPSRTNLDNENDQLDIQSPSIGHYMSNARHQEDNLKTMEEMLNDLSIGSGCESVGNLLSEAENDNLFDKLRKKYLFLKTKRQKADIRDAPPMTHHVQRHMRTVQSHPMSKPPQQNVSHNEQYAYFNNYNQGANRNNIRSNTKLGTDNYCHTNTNKFALEALPIQNQNFCGPQQQRGIPAANNVGQFAQSFTQTRYAKAFPSSEQNTYTVNRHANNFVHTHDSNVQAQNENFHRNAAIGKPQNITENYFNPFPYAATQQQAQMALPGYPPQYAQTTAMPYDNHPLQSVPFNQFHQYGMHSQFRAIPVDKWHVIFSNHRPLKDGEVGLHQFIEQIEMYTQANRMHPDIVASQIGILLKGPALEWYLRSRGGITGWNDLVTKMKLKFLSSTFQFETLDEITNRKQRDNESVSSYISDMIKRFRTLPEPHKEDSQCHIIQNNLRSSIYDKLISERFIKIEHLEERARNVERNLETRQASQNPTKQGQKTYRPKINECAVQSDESESGSIDNDLDENSDDEILMIQKMIKKIIKGGNRRSKTQVSSSNQAVNSSLSKSSSSKSTPSKIDSHPLVCYKCKEPGHSFRSCPDTTEKFFCFTCGRDDVITPKCPVCNPKNAKTDSQIRESGHQ